MYKRQALAILDKSDSINNAGSSLFTDITSSLFVHKVNVPTVGYIYGIGGRDVREEDIEKVFTDLEDIKQNKVVEKPYRYLGLRS